MNHNVFCEAAKTKSIRAGDEAGICGKGTRAGPLRPVPRYQMRQRRRRIADDARRPAVSLDLSKLQLIFPIQSAKRRLFRAALFFGSAASFSQQIPRVICERSCRMAKTLSVNITPILKKERGKTKKNKKNMVFLSFSLKKSFKNMPGQGDHPDRRGGEAPRRK